MTLNELLGSIATGVGVSPSGANQRAKSSPSPSLSRATRRAVISPDTDARCFETSASLKRCVAPQSSSMVMSCAGVADGGSGATVAPARTIAMKSATYSIELDAQIETISPGRTPSRCNDAAMRSTSAFSSANETSSLPQITAVRFGCSVTRIRNMSSHVPNSWVTYSAMSTSIPLTRAHTNRVAHLE
jgi:hypothetical protein